MTIFKKILCVLDNISKMLHCNCFLHCFQSCGGMVGPTVAFYITDWRL